MNTTKGRKKLRLYKMRFRKDSFDMYFEEIAYK